MKCYLSIFKGMVFLLLTIPAHAGPYEMTLPIEGVTSKHIPELQKVFEERHIEIFSDTLQIKHGVIQFFTGGHSVESMLKLDDVSDAIKEVGLHINTEKWILKEQLMGVCLSTDDAIGVKKLSKTIESYKEGNIKVLRTVLIGDQMCEIIQLNDAVNYTHFQAHLKQSNVQIINLVWGHWKNGWGIEEGYHDRKHSFGALIKKTGT